jgi:hypothetical protein
MRDAPAAEDDQEAHESEREVAAGRDHAFAATTGSRHARGR